jgi:hypothetical protein
MEDQRAGWSSPTTRPSRPTASGCGSARRPTGGGESAGVAAGRAGVTGHGVPRRLPIAIQSERVAWLGRSVLDRVHIERDAHRRGQDWHRRRSLPVPLHAPCDRVSTRRHHLRSSLAIGSCPGGAALPVTVAANEPRAAVSQKSGQPAVMAETVRLLKHHYGLKIGRCPAKHLLIRDYIYMERNGSCILESIDDRMSLDKGAGLQSAGIGFGAYDTPPE